MSRPVVLAALDWWRPGDPRTSLGVASIAAALRQAGAEVKVVSDAVNRPGFAVDAWLERVADAVAVREAPLVGVSAFVWAEPEVQALIGTLARTDATVVLGGPQVSYVGRGGLESLYPGVDVFVRGHGEAAMVALATGGDLEGRGVHFAGTLDLAARADGDLGALPSPYLAGAIPIGPVVRWETQRGCPFRCSFCQHREPGARLVNRHLGFERVLAEAAAFVTAGVHRISVLDPIFHADRARAVALLGELRRLGLRARLSLQCRFELVDEAFLQALEGMDIHLEFGLQTADDAEARAIARPNRMEVVDGVVRRLRARGIPFEVSLVYGLPLQTLDSFRRSVDWCRERGVPRVRAWPLMLLRGTPLHADRVRWGFVESVGERIPIVVASHSFTRQDHAEMGRLADALHAEDAARESA